MIYNTTVNLKQASEISGINEHVLRKEIEKGHLVANGKGNRTRIQVDELEVYCVWRSMDEYIPFDMYPYEAEQFYNRVSLCLGGAVGEFK